jgi:hypothetical protein
MALGQRGRMTRLNGTKLDYAIYHSLKCISRGDNLVKLWK